MLIPPKYRLNDKITKFLSSIEASREVIDEIAVDSKIELNIKRQSTLKSSLYSARIEGNKLSMDDLSKVSPRDRQKIEVFDLLKAVSFVNEQKSKIITADEIKKIHSIVMGLTFVSKNKIGFRNNMEAIFNSAGIAVRLFPPPRLIEPLMNRLLVYANSGREQFVPIKAVLAHYTFEKIHPFMDGNGRVGRLLMNRVLSLGGYGFKGMLPLEEYLDAYRTSYYRSLDEPEKEASDYVEFMLEAISETASKLRTILSEKHEDDPSDLLLPRRGEILRIIKDHKMVSFDRIRRRFVNINERTLRYDLKKLKDGGYIRKLGTTKGVYYTPVD